MADDETPKGMAPAMSGPRSKNEGAPFEVWGPSENYTDMHGNRMHERKSSNIKTLMGARRSMDRHDMIHGAAVHYIKEALTGKTRT